MRLFQSTIGDSRIDFERYHRPYAMNSYISYHFPSNILRLLYNMMAPHISITFNNHALLVLLKQVGFLLERDETEYSCVRLTFKQTNILTWTHIAAFSM